MALDDRYLPEKNEHLAALLRDNKFEGVQPKATPWGAVFIDEGDFFVIINPETGTTVHDHPNHTPGIITYIGPIEQDVQVENGTLAYKVQVNQNEQRTKGVDELVVPLSPGDQFYLIHGQTNNGVIGRRYGCHNHSKHPVAILLEQLKFQEN